MRTKPYATAIALFDEVELLDVTGPVSVLSSAGRQWNFQPFKIDFVAAAVGPVTTRSALTLHATHSWASHSGAECLLIPGGYGALRAAENEELLAWLRHSAARAELVGAIGNGVWLLAKAGLLEQVQVAASAELAPEISAVMPKRGAQLTRPGMHLGQGAQRACQRFEPGSKLRNRLTLLRKKARLGPLRSARHRLVRRAQRPGYRARPAAALNRKKWRNRSHCPPDGTTMSASPSR